MKYINLQDKRHGSSNYESEMSVETDESVVFVEDVSSLTGESVIDLAGAGE